MHIWLLAGSVCALMLLALQGHAQTTPQSMPQNASAKSYGDGWECNIGYRLTGDVCAAIVVPQYAYATNRKYGVGWECRHGYQWDGSTACVAVFVPKGGYLGPSGERWLCLRGFAKVDEVCRKIVLPENAYLTETVSGSTWDCARGFEAKDDRCVAIVVPANAYLNASSYGRPWTCERGFFEQAGQCESVVIPANAFFDDATYGTGWKCERGYAASAETCQAIDIPANAHLDLSGNRWQCNKNFQRSRGQCVLNN